MCRHAKTSPAPPHLQADSEDFPSTYEGNEVWDGTNFVNNWSQSRTLTKSLPAPTGPGPSGEPISPEARIHPTPPILNSIIGPGCG